MRRSVRRFWIFLAGGGLTGHTPEIQAGWAEFKAEITRRPTTIPVIIHSRTFGMTTFRLITRS